jgi:hypothetical protein
MNELNVPLRFYDTLEEKYRYRPECDGVKLPSDYFHLLYPGDFIPPFQIYKEYEMTEMPDVMDTVTLVNVCTGDRTDIPIVDFNDYVNIYAAEFNGEQRIYTIHYGATGYGFLPGIYYLEIVWGSYTFYSEDWKSVDFNDDEENYRVVQRLGDIRKVSSTDLRVWKQ